MITIQDLKEAEQRLERELRGVKAHILALVGRPTRKARKSGTTGLRKRRRMSAKGRAAIAAAQKKRWASVKAGKRG
jgi:hypothetical protein